MSLRHEIKSLTGLRGVAALVVVAYHYSVMNPGGDFYKAPIGPGYLAVDLFFLLSGFVMAANYAPAFAGRFSPVLYVQFLERRFARVYPLYALVAVLVFAASKAQLMLPVSHPSQAFLTNILGVQNLGPGLVRPDLGRSLDGPGWSISTEMAAYLVFPWLAKATLFGSRGSAARAAAVAILALALFMALPEAWFPEARRGPLDVSFGTSLWPLVRCLAGFTLGLIVFRLARNDGVGRHGLADILIVASLLALWVIPSSDVLVVGVFAVLIWQVCTDRSPLARLLGGRVPIVLGNLSYAIYLLHGLALAALPRLYRILGDIGIPHPWAASLVLLFLGVLPVAWLAYKYIEVPSRRILWQIFEHRRPGSIRGEPAAP